MIARMEREFFSQAEVVVGLARARERESRRALRAALLRRWGRRGVRLVSPAL